VVAGRRHAGHHRGIGQRPGGQRASSSSWSGSRRSRSSCLPYAAGDRRSARSLVVVRDPRVAGWIGFAWRVVELLLAGAFQFSTPAEVLTNGPGLWISAIGLAILSRATYVMTRESAYR
jgi:hypothetical protein